MAIRKIRYKDRAEWLEIRRRYIGGSEAGAVVGMNPYKSAYTLWAEKTGKMPEFGGNITTKVGAYLEDLVASMFEEETGKKVRRANFTFVNDDYPFACANVDREIVGENAVLECKTTNSLPAMRKISGGEFPDQWYCQVVHYMAVKGYERAYLAVLVGCREFKIYVLERDEDEINSLMAAEKQFWGSVENDEPPEITGSESTTDTLNTIYAESNNDECVLVGHERDLAEYTDIGNQIKALKALQDGYANRVKAFMGSSSRGSSTNYNVTWTSSVRRSFDVGRFAESHPEIDLSEYYNQTNVRTFKVKKLN